MILDKKLNATLDQETQCLTMIDEEEKGMLFENSISAMENLKKVLESLSIKASLIK